MKCSRNLSGPNPRNNLYSVCVHYTEMAPVLAIRFDPRSGIPALHQIVDQLRVLLVEGQLAPGASLPSVRRLAMELGVHFNTVAEAYRELAADGWLDLQHGRGALVIDRPLRTSNSKNRIDEFRTRLRGLVAELRAAGIPVDDLAAELKAMAKGVKES